MFFGENKGIMLQTLRGKLKYKITNVGVEKIKLSRLLVLNNLKFDSVAKLFCDLSPTVLNFYGKNLKLYSKLCIKVC